MLLGAEALQSATRGCVIGVLKLIGGHHSDISIFSVLSSYRRLETIRKRSFVLKSQSCDSLVIGVGSPKRVCNFSVATRDCVRLGVWRTLAEKLRRRFIISSQKVHDVRPENVLSRGRCMKRNRAMGKTMEGTIDNIYLHPFPAVGDTDRRCLVFCTD